jgi:hypothetical protein
MKRTLLRQTAGLLVVAFVTGATSCDNDVTIPDPEEADIGLYESDATGNPLALGGTGGSGGAPAGGLANGGSAAAGALSSCLPASLERTVSVGDEFLVTAKVDDVPPSQEPTLVLRASGAVRFKSQTGPVEEVTERILTRQGASFHTFVLVATGVGFGKVTVVTPSSDATFLKEVTARPVTGVLTPLFRGLSGVDAQYFIPVCSTAPAGTPVTITVSAGSLSNVKSTLEAALGRCPAGYRSYADALWTGRSPNIAIAVSAVETSRDCLASMAEVIISVDVQLASAPLWQPTAEKTSGAVVELLVQGLRSAPAPVDLSGVDLVADPNSLIKIETIPATDAQGRTAMFITVPTNLKTVPLSLLVGGRFRRQLNIPGPFSSGGSGGMGGESGSPGEGGGGAGGEAGDGGAAGGGIGGTAGTGG